MTKEHNTKKVAEPGYMTLKFDQGLYGFEDIREYRLVEPEDTGNPFRWLQAADETVCFAVLDPSFVISNYDKMIMNEIVEAVGEGVPYRLLSIVVIPENLEEMTINLQSPIILNMTEMKASQVILDDERFSIRHRLISNDKKVKTG